MNKRATVDRTRIEIMDLSDQKSDRKSVSNIARRVHPPDGVGACTPCPPPVTLLRHWHMNDGRSTSIRHPGTVPDVWDLVLVTWRPYILCGGRCPKGHTCTSCLAATRLA
jgi:hypothetical protein